MTHPTIRHLADHATGALSGGMRLLVASHLTFCARCRDRVSRLEGLGGALLAAEPVPGTVAPPEFGETLARIAGRHQAAEPAKAPEKAMDDAPHLPRPIRHALRGRPGRLRWRRLLPGVWDIRLPGDGGEDVRLLKARPGTRIPTHTHVGHEANLVLAGQLRDGARTFGPGEVSVCGPEHNHSPEVVGGEECLCLLVLGGGLRFTGPVARILNILPL